jgi:hypothetical protein
MLEQEEKCIIKYKDLIIEIQHMQIVKTKVIPAIIGATGTISKSDNTCANQLQCYIPSKHGLFQVCNCKYHA